MEPVPVLDRAGILDEVAAFASPRYPASWLKKPFARSLAVLTFNLADSIAESKSKSKRLPEYRWLFELAGLVKSFARFDSDLDDPRAVMPLVLAFADRLRQSEALVSKPKVDWGSPEALELAFADAFESRLLSRNSTALADAADAALNLAGELPSLNFFVAAITVMAVYLSEHNQGIPFLIPVNRKTADLLKTTPMTVSSALSRAIKLEVISVADTNYTASARKARKFQINRESPIVVEAMQLLETYLQASPPSEETSG